MNREQTFWLLIKDVHPTNHKCNYSFQRLESLRKFTCMYLVANILFVVLNLSFFVVVVSSTSYGGAIIYQCKIGVIIIVTPWE